MSENITNLPEKIELIPGGALNARQKSLAMFVGLGPPDLCVITKTYTKPKFVPNAIIKSNSAGYFHWVFGMDASSSYQIGNYFELLISNQEKKGVTRGSYSLNELHYVSYNAFRKMDLHVEITKPGNAITTYSIDGSGGKHEVDDVFWRQCYVSQMLRYINGPPRDIRPIRMFHSLTEKAGEESRFLTLCAEFFQDSCTSLAPGLPTIPSSEPKPQSTSKFTDISNNLMTTTLCYYFIRHNRFDPLISFLSNWKDSDLTVTVPISSALSLDGDLEKARAILEGALIAEPENISLLIALVELSIKDVQGLAVGSTERDSKLESALNVAMKSVELKPELTRIWFLLSRVLVEMGRYEWALAALNHAPLDYDQVERNKLAGIDRTGTQIQFSRMTTPLSVAHDIVLDTQDEIKEFEAQAGENTLRLLSAAALYGEERVVYEILSDVVAKIGWENLIRARDRVLVRPAELDRELAKNDKATGREEHMEAVTHASNITQDSMVVEPETENNPFNEQGELKEKENEIQKESVSTETSNPVVSSSSNSNMELNEDEDEEETETVTVTEKETETKTEVVEEKYERRPSDSFEEVSLAPAVFEDAVEEVVILPPIPASPEPVHENSESNSLADSSSSITTSSQFNEVATQTDPDKVDQQMAKFLLHYRRKNRKFASPPFTIDVDADSGATLDIPIADISPRVELSFHSLFQDIKAFHMWKEEEKSKADSEGSVTHLAANKINAERTTADWIRLGLVANRLKFRDDAEKLFLLAGASPIAWSSLLGIYSTKGDIRNTIVTASAIQKYYSEKYKTTQTHPEVVAAVIKVMGYYGLQKVRNIQASIPDCNTVIPNILFDSVLYRSKGFDL